MTVTVRIPTPLRAFTDGADEVSVEGETVGDVLENLARSYEGFGDRVLDGDGGLRHFVNVYLGSQDIRTRDGLGTSVDDGDVLSIIPAVAGGRT